MLTVPGNLSHGPMQQSGNFLLLPSPDLRGAPAITLQAVLKHALELAAVPEPPEVITTNRQSSAE